MSKTVRLSEEAYERLAEHKREGETFSDVVLRLAGEPSLLELAGIMSDEETDALRAVVSKRRERRNEELTAAYRDASKSAEELTAAWDSTSQSSWFDLKEK